MRVTRLKLENVRAVEAAEFNFRPGFNLIAGVDGVGKTTVLDALIVCLSDVVMRVNNLRRYRIRFCIDDIRRGADSLGVFCDVEDAVRGKQYAYVFRRSREQVDDTPEMAGFAGDAPPFANGEEPSGRPMAILFSTNRAVPSEKALAKSPAAGGVAGAFSDTLSSRELRLGDFAAWMRTRQALSEESPEAGRALKAFERAVTRFLPGYRNLRPDRTDERSRSLLIDRNDGMTLSVKLLSDGERGALAMVLDLTRRLAQANPRMEDPAAEAEAIVLIDKIELHLHPAWQRRIIQNLTKTFPKCQFIATTHSPQVIGELEHNRIQIIADGEVYSPSHSFGVDTSRVVEKIMNAEPRAEEVKRLLTEISRTIDKDQYEEAHALLIELRCRLGENDPEVTRIRTLLDFMAGDE